MIIRVRHRIVSIIIALSLVLVACGPSLPPYHGAFLQEGSNQFIELERVGS